MIKTKLQKYSPLTDIETATAEQREEACEAIKQKYLAITFLAETSNKEYAHIINSFENDYPLGDHEAYSTTLENAFELLLNWRGTNDRNPR